MVTTGVFGWDEPPGPDGKRRSRKQSCRGMSKKEAELELARIMAEMAPSTPLPTITVYRAYRAEAILDDIMPLTKWFPPLKMLQPGRVFDNNMVLEVREAALEGDIQAVYFADLEEDSRQLLVWDESLSPAERLKVLGLPGDSPRIEKR